MRPISFVILVACDVEGERCESKVIVFGHMAVSCLFPSQKTNSEGSVFTDSVNTQRGEGGEVLEGFP